MLPEQGSGSSKKLKVVNMVLLVVLMVFLGINQSIIVNVGNKMSGNQPSFVSWAKLFNNSGTTSVALAGNLSEDAIKLVIAQGVPDIYGPEMGVSFDAVQDSINKMKIYDPTYGKQKITLTGDKLQRYIDVAIKISCEYCCGAQSIIAADGSGACGCAHSQAMRGLAAYLVDSHGDKYTNDEVLRELAKWKGLYFPKQMIQKMATQLQSGDFTPDVAALILNVQLPDYGRGGAGVPLPSEIDNLPGMVGGC